MISDTLLRQGAAILSDAGIVGSSREARIIARTVPLDDVEKFMSMIRQRATRVPLSHVLGYRDFYNHRFIVSADVLDPRPDTEALVIAALEQPFENVLDLGTGSGCILLSLLAAQTTAKGVGTDISEAALAVAAENRAQLGLQEQATLVQSDWFAAIEGAFDLIVSNPPYIAAAEMPDLQPEVRLHEPHLALTDNADGLNAYRKITAGCLDHLTPGGRLMVEIGPTQAPEVSAMMRAVGLQQIRVIPDIDGRDRVVVGHRS